MQQQQQAVCDAIDSTTAATAAAGHFQPPQAAILISPAADLSMTSVFLRNKQLQDQGPDERAPLLASGSSSEQDDFQWDYVSSTEGHLILHRYLFSQDFKALTNPLVSPIYMQVGQVMMSVSAYLLQAPGTQNWAVAGQERSAVKVLSQCLSDSNNAGCNW
jgi:hypothetical protein